jgi:MATE family multidrug resistance protein
MVPMLLAGFGYWGAGFGASWLFAFPLGYGAVGLWWGLALGLGAVAVLLTLRLGLLAPPVTQAVEAVAVR